MNRTHTRPHHKRIVTESEFGLLPVAVRNAFRSYLLPFVAILSLCIADSYRLSAAALFDGNSQSYAISQGHLGGGNDNLVNWTIELWIKPASVAAYQGVFNIHGNWKETSITLGPNGQIGITTYIPNTSYPASSQPGIITTNEWQLITITSDGKNVRIYRNGVSIAIGDSPPQMFVAGEVLGSIPATFDFGFSNYQTLPAANWYSGQMADFRLWNRNLTNVEILEHYSRQPDVKSSGLVNWIPFNEKSGDTFYDVAGGVTGKYSKIILTSETGVKESLSIYSAVEVGFQTALGSKYLLENSSDLTTWTPQGDVIVGTGKIQSYFFRASKVNQFWRLKVVP